LIVYFNGILKKKTKQSGILGKVIAFAPAHEEQGRKTLHSHWQIWVQEQRIIVE
jgi:hypothetical protein